MTIETRRAGVLFENSDICRCRTEYAAGIGDIWFVVSARVDNGDGTQNYTCTYSSGTRSITYPAGAPVLDYGVSGDGGLYLTADDTNGPFIDVFTHAGAPWATLTERVRMGNLNGVGDYVADAYGIFIGDYAGDMWMSYDPTNGLRIRGDALVDGTVSAEALVMGDYDLFFSQADGLLLLGPGCEITPTSWTGTRGQVATISGAFHQVQGPWANSRALCFEPAATNLVKDPSFEFGTLSTYWANWGSPPTRELSTTRSVKGVTSLRLITNATNQGVSQSLTLANGTTYTATVYVYCVSGSAVLMIYNGTDFYANVSTKVGQWQRLKMTVVAGATNTLYLGRSASGSAGEYFFDCVQVEASSFATSYLDGSLGTGYAWTGTPHASTSTRNTSYATFNPSGVIDLSNGSMSFWFQMPYNAGTSGLSITRGLFAWWNSWNTESFYTQFGSDFSGFRVVTYTGSAQQVNIYASLSGSKAGDWHHIVITTTTNSVNLYIDGVLKSTDTSYAAPAITSKTAYLGYVTASFGGAIAEFASFSRVLTAEEVAALYTHGKPLADAGALTKPGVYILDGLFKLASSTTGLRTELTAAGLGVYDGAGLTSVGRVLVGMVDTTGTVLDETATDLGMFGYDASDNLQVAWYASGANAGKVMAGAGNVWLDADGIRLEALTGKFSAASIEWYDGATREFSIGCEVDLGAVTNGYLSADTGLVLESTSGIISLLPAVYVYVNGGYFWVNDDARFAGGIAVGSGMLNPDTGAIHFVERSSDPTEPVEGQAVIWMSDGTGKGDDGDVLIASKAGGSTTYAILFDHSAGSAW